MVGVVGSVFTLTAGVLTVEAAVVVALVTVVWAVFLGLPLCPVPFVVVVVVPPAVVLVLA